VRYVCGRRVDTGEVVTLTLDAGVIAAITPGRVEAGQGAVLGGADAYVSPGYFDIQINGYGGSDFNASAWGAREEVVHDPAECERDVGAKLVPESHATRIARRVLLRFDAAELHTRGAFRLMSRQTGSLEVLGAQIDVVLKLGIHLAFIIASPDDVASECAHTGQGIAHIDSVVARSAAVIPATTSSHIDRSSRSCFRPAGVSE